MNTLLKLMLATSLCTIINLVPAYSTSPEPEEDSSNSIAKTLLTARASLNSLESFFSDLKDIAPNIIKTEMHWLSEETTFENEEVNALLQKFRSHDEIQPLNALIANTLFEKFPNKLEIIVHAAAVENPEAQYKLAMSIRDENPELSSQLIHQAASKKHVESLYELSESYSRVPYYFGLELNPFLGRLLCEEAARLGHEKAQLSLATAPLDGNYDTEKDFNKGKAQLRELASKGNKEAQEMYEQFKDVSEEEYEYFSNM